MNNYLKVFPVTAVGFITDTLRAAMTAALTAIAANAGTIGGAALGCAVGVKVGGATGCAIGGALFGFLGSALNVATGPALIPVGIMLAVVISFCISLAFGTMIVMFLIYMGMFYPSQVLLAYGSGIIPLAPSWTVLTLRAAHRKNKEERLHIHAKAA